MTELIESADSLARTKGLIGDYPYIVGTEDRLTYIEEETRWLPHYSPAEMLRLGIFGGIYWATDINHFWALPQECKIAHYQRFKEVFPDEILATHLAAVALLVQNRYVIRFNKYPCKCGQSLAEWQKKGWIHPRDPLGWFQWYCKFYYGIRGEDDRRQIERAQNFRTRHMGMLRHITGGDFDNPMLGVKTKQALLHWSTDYRRMM